MSGAWATSVPVQSGAGPGDGAAHLGCLSPVSGSWRSKGARGEKAALLSVWFLSVHLTSVGFSHGVREDPRENGSIQDL